MTFEFPLQSGNVPFLHLIGGYRQISVIGNDLRHSNMPWRIDDQPNPQPLNHDEFYQAANAVPVRQASRETLEEQIEALRERLQVLENDRHR